MKKTGLLIAFMSLQFFTHAQNEKTTIRGFMDINGLYDADKGKFGFALGEQDLFITSDISDKVSFLGETVFKYSSTSSTHFSISLERAIFKYNYKGNHSFFAGKVHTALNYWNDTYHHGRLFFPTVGRPEVFNQSIIPIHTTGFGLSGQDLTNVKFGYTLMVGNGIGSEDIFDNNFQKSYTAAVYLKPIEGLRIGLSSYFDNIDGDVHDHSGGVHHVHDVKQSVYSASVAYFKNKIEFLAESSMSINGTNDTILPNGKSQTIAHAAYAYAGYRIKDMIIPYARFDYVSMEYGDLFYNEKYTNVMTLGVRYEMNYLTSIKLEYQYKDSGTPNATSNFNRNSFTNNIYLQIAIGF